MIDAARFFWWMAAAALAIAFLDIVARTFGPRQWLERATRARVVLGVLEVGTIGAWLAVHGRWRFLPLQDAGVAFAGAMLALTGALLAAWAKARLGRLFSPQLGVQQGHQLITTGPYAIVRHPIYLGLVDFMLGSALFWNDVALFVAALLFIIYFAFQLRIEERFFAEHFGKDWEEYRARTPPLFPRVWGLRRKDRG